MTAPTEVTVAGRPAGWEETWKSPAGFSSYEASNNSVWTLGEDGKPVQVSGGIRSVDRVAGGRRCKGTLLKSRILSNSGGYAAVNPVNDQGVKCSGTLVHRLILLAFAGECPPGMETRHLVNDPLDCRWAPGETAEEVIAAGGNVVYGPPWANVEDQFRNGRKRADPKPDRHCILCSAVLTTNGRRCRPCIVKIGEQAAELLWSGISLAVACDRLEYPSETGLHTLAVKHGGYGRPSWRWRVRRKLTFRSRRSESRQADGDGE
jgi:hypothetical protein